MKCFNYAMVLSGALGLALCGFGLGYAQTQHTQASNSTHNVSTILDTLKLVKTNDLNGNGIIDSGDDAPLPLGVTAIFSIQRNGNSFSYDTLGNGISSLKIPLLGAGSYTIEEVEAPEGWVQTLGGKQTLFFSGTGVTKTARFMNTNSPSATTAIAFGRIHRALGGAHLGALADHTLIVSGIGSSGNDGFTVTLEERTTFSVMLDPVHFNSLIATLDLSATGVVNGLDNTPIGEVSFCCKGEDEWHVASNFSSIGATMTKVEVLDHGQLTGSTIIASGEIGRLHAPAGLIQTGKLFTVPGCIPMEFDSTVTITLSDNSVYSGNEIRVLAANPSGTITQLSSFSFRASNINTPIHIVDESPIQRVPVLTNYGTLLLALMLVGTSSWLHNLNRKRKAATARP